MKTNILIIESGSSGGGSFIGLYQQLLFIKRDRFRPVVVFLNNNSFVEAVKSLGIPVYVLTDRLYSKHYSSLIQCTLLKIASVIEKYTPNRYLPFLKIVHKPVIVLLEQIVHEEEINIIHMNVQINRDLFGLFVAEKTKVACISYLRSTRSRGFDRYRAEYANRIVSMFIANSKNTKQYWCRMGLDSNKIKVVYNTIVGNQGKPSKTYKTWKIEKNLQFVIGCVATFSRGKGHEFLLKAFARLKEIRSDAVLLLVGDGPLRDEVAQQALKLSISEFVIFTGYIVNAKDIIASLDLLVLPSQTEAFGRVLLEAMQAEVPVVATNVGGVPELVQHEYNGLLVDYGDEEGFQKAIERVMTDGNFRSKLIENGLKTVERYSIEKYISEIESIYETIDKC